MTSYFKRSFNAIYKYTAFSLQTEISRALSVPHNNLSARLSKNDPPQSTDKRTGALGVTCCLAWSRRQVSDFGQKHRPSDKSTGLFLVQCAFPFTSGSQSVGTLGKGLGEVPETFSGHLQGQSHFHNQGRLICLFHLHSLMSVQWSFPETTWYVTLQEMEHQSRYETPARLLSQTWQGLAKKHKTITFLSWVVLRK